jgi:hypothetical protein
MKYYFSSALAVAINGRQSRARHACASSSRRSASTKWILQWRRHAQLVMQCAWTLWQARFRNSSKVRHQLAAPGATCAICVTTKESFQQIVVRRKHKTWLNMRNKVWEFSFYNKLIKHQFEMNSLILPVILEPCGPLAHRALIIHPTDSKWKKWAHVHKNANDTLIVVSHSLHKRASFLPGRGRSSSNYTTSNKPHNPKCTSDDSHANHTVCTYTPKNKK